MSQQTPSDGRSYPAYHTPQQHQQHQQHQLHYDGQQDPNSAASSINGNINSVLTPNPTYPQTVNTADNHNDNPVSATFLPKASSAPGSSWQQHSLAQQNQHQETAMDSNNNNMNSNNNNMNNTSNNMINTTQNNAQQHYNHTQHHPQMQHSQLQQQQQQQQQQQPYHNQNHEYDSFSNINTQQQQQLQSRRQQQPAQLSSNNAAEEHGAHKEQHHSSSADTTHNADNNEHNTTASNANATTTTTASSSHKSRRRKKVTEGEAGTFQGLWAKYNKKRRRGGGSGDPPSNPEDQIQFLCQVIHYQALQILKMDDRISRLEGTLPPVGTFDDPGATGKEDAKDSNGGASSTMDILGSEEPQAKRQRLNDGSSSIKKE